MKYRAWNNKRKKFIENDVDIKDRKNYCLGEYALTPNGKLCFYEEEEGGMTVFEIENVEINFCTGLKDKNGKEIWQDDLILYKDHKKEIILRIMLEPGGFIAIQVKEINSSIPIWEDLSNLQTQGWIKNACEVIGNIYENENLLK